MARQRPRRTAERSQSSGGRVDAGLARAAAILGRLANRISQLFAPIERIATNVASTFAAIAQASSKIAASLRSTAASLKEIKGMAAGGGGGGQRGVGTAAAQGAVSGVAEGVGALAASSGLPALWAKISGASAATAATTATTSASIAASAGSAAGFASSAAAAGAALAAAAPYVLAIAAAGATIYVVWQQLEAIWPTIVQDLVAAAKALSSVVQFTVALANPMTYVRAAWAAIAAPVRLVTAGVSKLAGLTRDALVGAVNAVRSAWDRVSSAVQATVSKIGSALRSTGAAAARVGQAIAGGFRSAAAGANYLLERTALAGLALAGLGAAVVGPMTVAANRFGEAGTSAAELATRAGASAQAMSELAYAADRVGVPIGEVADAIASVGGEANFIALGDEIAQISDPARRSAEAIEAFGAAGPRLLALFDRGPEGLRAMREEAVRLGLTFDGPAAASASALTRSYQMLQDGLRGLWQTIGQAVAPAITDWNELLVGAVQGAIRWAKANQPLIANIFRLAEGAVMVGTAIATIAGSIGPALPAILGLATGAAAAGVAWSTFGESVRRVVGPVVAAAQRLYGEVSRVFGGITDAIRGGQLELAVEVAWLGIQAAWVGGLNALTSITNTAIGGIADALASGDFASAGRQAWGQIQIAFEAGAQTLDTVWTSILNGIDRVATYLREAIVNALKEVARALDSFVAGAAQRFADMGLTSAAESLNSLGSLNAMIPSAAGAQEELAARIAERERRTAAEREASEKRIAELRAQSGAEAGAAGAAAETRRAELQAKLDDAIKRAAEARREAMAKTPLEIERDRILGDRQGAGVGVSSGATFSAAALMALGGRGAGPEQLQRQQLAKLDKQIEQNERLIRAVAMEFVA